MIVNNVYTQDYGGLDTYRNENVLLSKSGNDGKRVVFFGNSITKGWKELSPDFFNNNSFINRGISGQTTDQMLIRFRSDVINLQPLVVVILAGTNDIAQNNGPVSVDEILGNIISMVQLAKANNISVVLCTVLPVKKYRWRPEINPIPLIKSLNTALQNYALENNLQFVDYYSAMSDSDNGLQSDLSHDGVHPNYKGYCIMEPLVLTAIKVYTQK